ncbi:glycosyltransferase family 4 protein [Patescibacteria group bacterium]|nr:glycosyltransferase family 4 protein [Patescibacteria group bacterium]
MKIAIIVSTFPPYLAGIGNVAYHQALNLSKLGYEVEVLTPNYKERKLQVEKMSGFTLKKIPPSYTFGNAAFVPSIKGQIKKNKYDIVHLHYPFFGGAEFVKVTKNQKLVLHYHMDTVGRGWKGLIFKLHRKIALPKIIKRAHKIIVTSNDYAKNSLLKDDLKNNPNKYVEIPNGVDIEKFSPAAKDTELMSQLEIDPFTRVILFVGGLDSAHYFKGIEYLIKAYKLIKNTEAGKQTKLIIVGEGDLRPDYEDLAHQLNLFDHIKFTGKVEEIDLPKYYNISDMVVLPSIDQSEAFGMALIEGMACGKAVIGSNLPGVRSVIDDKQNGLLVVPKNEKDLAQKLDQLIVNADMAMQQGKAGRQKVEDEYAWDKFIQNIDQLYKSL